MAKPKPRQKLVILISGGNTTQGLAPRLLNDYDVAVYEPQIAQALAQKFGERVIPLGNFVTAELQNQAANEAVTQSARVLAGGTLGVAQRIEQVDAWEHFRGNGLAKDLAQWFPAYVHGSLQRQIVRLLALDRLAETRRVKLVVTHEDVTETYGGLARWATVRGIPTLHVPHANSYMLPEYGPDLHETSICDAIAATPHMADFYRERGYAGEIHITGSPLFDRWAAYEKDRVWAQRCLNLDPARPVVVYASSWGQRTNARDNLERFDAALIAMLTAAANHPDWQLVIKMHPGEPANAERAYAQAAQDYGVDVVITRQYLELVLSAADVLVALGPSNVLVDAALMDVPGICLRLPGFQMDGAAVVEIEPSTGAQDDADALAAAIERALTIEGQAEWTAQRADLIYRNAYLADGKATARVATLCKELA